MEVSVLKALYIQHLIEGTIHLMEASAENKNLIVPRTMQITGKYAAS